MASNEVDKLISGLGARVRTLRESRGWTQERLAELVEMSAQAVARLERSESKPSLGTLLRLCQALDVSPDVLVGWSTERGEAIQDLEREAYLAQLNRSAEALPLSVVRTLADMAETVSGELGRE